MGGAGEEWESKLGVAEERNGRIGRDSNMKKRSGFDAIVVYWCVEEYCV